MTGTTGRLFHAIVAMGVALTGGAAACGGGSSSGEQDAAAADGACTPGSTGCDAAYAHIGYNGDAYAGISIDAAPPPDTGTDSYAHISVDTGIQDAPPDCYPCIAPNLGG